MNTRKARDNKLKMIAAGCFLQPDQPRMMEALAEAYAAGVEAAMDQLNVDSEIAKYVRKHTGAV